MFGTLSLDKVEILKNDCCWYGQLIIFQMGIIVVWFADYTDGHYRDEH